MRPSATENHGQRPRGVFRVPRSTESGARLLHHHHTAYGFFQNQVNKTGSENVDEPVCKATFFLAFFTLEKSKFLSFLLSIKNLDSLHKVIFTNSERKSRRMATTIWRKCGRTSIWSCRTQWPTMSRIRYGKFANFHNPFCRNWLC